MAEDMAIMIGAMLGFVVFRELSKHGYSLTDPATRRTAWTTIGVVSAVWFVVVFVTMARLPR